MADQYSARTVVPVTIKQLKHREWRGDACYIDNIRVHYAVVVGLVLSNNSADEGGESPSTFSIDDSTSVIDGVTLPIRPDGADEIAEHYCKLVMGFRQNQNDGCDISVVTCSPIKDHNETYHHLLLAYKAYATQAKPQAFGTASAAAPHQQMTAVGGLTTNANDPPSLAQAIAEHAVDNPQFATVLRALYNLQGPLPNGPTKEELFHQVRDAFPSPMDFDRLFQRIVDDGHLYTTADGRYGNLFFS
jgi:hypothetical protein